MPGATALNPHFVNRNTRSSRELVWLWFDYSLYIFSGSRLELITPGVVFDSTIRAFTAGDIDLKRAQFVKLVNVFFVVGRVVEKQVILFLIQSLNGCKVIKSCI